MTREFVDRVISKFERGDILLLQNEINELSYIIDKAYERGLEIILNPSPYDQNLEGCDFGKISMFLLNEIEGEQITGVCKPEEILDELEGTISRREGCTDFRRPGRCLSGSGTVLPTGHLPSRSRRYDGCR